METVDTYIHHIRQVATLLGYQEPQILEVLKNTVPTQLHWVLFPIMDLRQAVETPKRILTKEKIDRQLAGQTSSSPFVNIKKGYSKKVTFDTTDGTEQKIDKLTVMMGKLVSEDGQNRQCKPSVHHSNRGRGQTRHNSEQRRFQNRIRSSNMYKGRSRYGHDYRGRSRYDSNCRGSYRYNIRGNQRYSKQNKDNRWENFRNQN